MPLETYYSDSHTTLYHGDMRNVMTELQQTYDCCVTDPPYGETSLKWDRWPDQWLWELVDWTSSLWCFGSLRMFVSRYAEFRHANWQLSQDVVWEKHNGSGFAADRFKRVHEHATHWYAGPWNDIYHQVPRVPATYDAKGRTRSGNAAGRRAEHAGEIGRGLYVDDGMRLARSVIYARSLHHEALVPTEKPVGVLVPLIEYACPPGGTVLDPFAGSGPTAVAARMTGRKAVLIEADEECCEATARRLSQDVLPVEA